MTSDATEAPVDAKPVTEAEWEAFAPPGQTPPSRLDLIRARARRLASHEWTLAALGSVGLAAVLTWPTLRQPATTIGEDIYDPTMQAWQVAWVGHALTTNPAGLWNANVSFPEADTLAYSDSLLGYAPFAMFGTGPVAALVRYNLLYVLAFALATFGAYALVRQLGASRMAGAVAGVAFAYAPWRFAHAGHLNILSSGGIVLALAMLARGHGWSMTGGFERDKVRPGWALAGWLVAAWQITLGFGLGISFGYVLITVMIVSGVGWLIRRPRLPRQLIGCDLVGGALFGITTLLMSIPYQRVVELHPDARRTVAWLDLFSPPLRGFFIATKESWLWGDSHAVARSSLSWAPEMTLLPGFFLTGLAIAGLAVSIWSVRQRLLLAAGVLLTVWLAMGTAAPWHGRYGYLLLFQLPGFDGIRTTGRLVLWTTLLLVILAAGAVAAFTQRGAALLADRPRDRPNGWITAIAVLPLLAVLVEGLHEVPHPVVPTTQVALGALPDPVLVLPTDALADMHVMLWSTDGFPRTVNGSSGYTPPRIDQLREAMKRFPDADTVSQLQQLGVKTVVVLRDRAANTPFEPALTAQVDGLNLTRDDRGYAVVFTIS